MTTSPIRPRQITALALTIAAWLTLTPGGAFAGEPIQPTASMAVARRGHTATVLSDGRVLIVGGLDASGPLPAAEVFDPAQKTFSSAGNLVNARYGHTATLLTNGRVLIAGGQDASGALASAEIFDPADTNGFRLLAATMGAARAGHTATVRNDGTVLLAGGDTAGTAEIFDPATESFYAPLLPMMNPRSGHTATPLADDNLFLVGGGTASIELFNGASNSFSLWPNGLSQIRSGHASIPTPDGKLLVIGGDVSGTFESFDPTTGSSLLSLGLGTPSTTANLLANNQILVLGPGVSGLFDETTGQLSPLVDTNASLLQLSGHTATELPTANKQILVAGGIDTSNNLLSSATLYNPAQISTDAGDYPPFSWVNIYGQGFLPNETVTNQVEEIVGPAAGTSYAPWGVTADTNGAFNTTWQVFSEDLLDTTLKLTAVGQSSGLKAETIFSDSASIQSATVNGLSSVTVTPGATISASVDNKNTANSNWRSTSWKISTTAPPGGTTCVDTPNHDGNGTFTEVFNITAPATPGTYNAYFIAFSDDACSAGASATFTLANAVIVKLASTTSITSSANPSAFGQSVTFTATVTGSGPTPTGTVTFKDGATTLGTGTLNGSGIATFPTSALTVIGSPHSITAVYGGDSNFNTSTSPALSQTVNKDATTTALTSSANPSVFGQSVTFTATVTANAPGSGTASGTVTFKDGLATLGTGTLNGSGIATLNTSALSVSGSPHSITAVYGGDASFVTSTSTAISQTVNPANSSTALTPSANPSVFGQSITFTATVTASAPGAGTPTGTVTFKDGVATIGTGTLNGSGVATFATTTLSVGPHSVTAVYAGDGNFNTSTSSTVNQTVNKAGAGTVLASSANPSVSGQSVTFTATVTASAPGSGTPTGTVTFKDGAAILGTGTLDGSGVATFTTSALTVAAHSITGVYGGDGNFNTSTSTILTQTVNKDPTTTALTSSANPSSFGQSGTFTATVTANAPGSGIPTGTVTFKDGATTVGTGTLDGSGVATFATSTLSVGSHSITAVYGGDGNFNTSTSSILTQTVNQSGTTTTVTSSANPSTYGQSVTFTATVAAAAPGSGTPSGTVTLKDGAATIGTGTLNGSGVATISTSTLSVSGSPHSITAVYAGNANFSTSTSSVLSQAVNPAALTITADNKTKPYGAALPALTVSYSGFVNGDTSASLTTPPTVTTTATAASHVSGNPYSITASGAVAANYTISYVAGTLTVTPVALIVTADNKTKVYGAALPTLTASYSGFVNGDTATSLATPPAITTTATASSHVSGNPYSISASGAVDSDYSISYVAGTLTVTPAALTITADDKPKAYGAALPIFTASYSGFVNGDSSASLTTQPTFSTTATAASHVSGNPHSITASGAVDTDYTISYAPGTLTVTPVALTITPNNQSKVYGAALPTLTVSYSGLVNGDTAASLTTPPTVTTTATAASPVSTYPISASGAVDADYVIGYGSGTLTVTTAGLTITANNQSKAYGAALPSFTVSYSGFVAGDTAASLTTPPTVTTTASAGSPVNTYPITANGAVDANYTITYVAGTLTVNPVALTITANSRTKTYGETVSFAGTEFASSGLVNGDTIASVTLNSAGAVATAGVGASPYNIVPSAAAGTGLGNYTIGYVNGTLTVNPATVTAIPTVLNKVYDGTNTATPDFAAGSAAFTGVLNGDHINLAQDAGSTATFSDRNAGTGKTVTVTNLKITGPDSGNYVLASTMATSTADITSRLLSITAVTNTKTYDGNTSALATPTVVGLQDADTISGLSEAYANRDAGTAKTLIPSGTVIDSITHLASGNYTVSFVNNTSGVINNAPLTITAATNTKGYDGTTTALATPTTSGLIGGDTVTGLVETYDTKNVGTGKTLSINAGFTVNDGFSGGNYTVTLVPNNTGVITAATLTVTADPQTKVYGSADPTFTYVATGFQVGDTAASVLIGNLTRAAGEHVAGSPYAITQGNLAANANYTIAFTGNSLTITPASLTVTADAQTKVYGQADPSLSYASIGLKFSDAAATVVTGALTRVAGEHVAGSPYAISQGSLAANSDYTLAFTGNNLSITPASLTITAEDKTKDYGAGLPALTASYSGFVNGDTAASLITPPIITTTAAGASHVSGNPYSITANGAVDADYTISYAAGTLTVTPVALTITADNKSKAYGAALPTLTVSYTGLANGDTAATFSTSPNTAPVIVTTATAASHVGSYTITATGAMDTDYTISYAAGALNVTPVGLTITADDQTKAYGAELPTLTASYSGFVNGDSSASLTTQPTLSTTATASSHVSSNPYTISASGAVDADYTISYVAGTLTVTPVAVTITAEDKDKDYGAALPALTVVYTGLVNGDTAATFTSAPNTPPTITTTAMANSHVAGNPYPITASGAADTDYTISYQAGKLTIKPVAVTITADNKSKAYGAALPTLTVTFTGLVNGDTAATFSTSPNTAPSIMTTATAASHVTGSPYSITASGAVDTDYTISYAAGQLTVTPVILTITADSKTKDYGAALPTLTASYSGFVNGDVASSLTTQPTLTTTATALSHVAGNPYSITASAAVDTDYTISYVAGTLAVEPVALTIKADDQTKAYGAALPTLTVTYSGLVNGDTAATFSAGPNTAPSISTTATTSSHVAGSPYSITASGAADTDYTISYAAGQLTVTPVSLTITTDNKTKAYGAALPTLTVSYSGFVNSDTAASLTTQPTLVTTATAASHVSGNPYSIPASGAVDSDYTIGYVAGTLTVTPVSLTITADNQTKAYGAALPTLTVSYSGFVNSDTAASLTAQPTLVTTATAASHVSGNPYSITASGAVDSDYTIDYVAGTLTVTPVGLTITADNQTKAYGAALPTLTLSYLGFVNSDTAASLTTQPTIVTTATAASHVSGNPYSITASGAMDSDYTIDYVAGTLTVTPVGLTITAENKTKPYGAALPSLTVTYTGFVNGDSASSLTMPPTVTTTATASSHVSGNPYSITAVGAVDADYTIGYVSGTLMVTPVALVVTADNQAKVYGTSLPTLTASYSGFVNGDTSASLTTQPALSTTATTSSPVATYPITASGAVDADYMISYVAGTLTISKATTGTLVISSQNPTVLGTLITFTATVSDSSSGSAGAPSGMVTLKDGATTIGTPTLSGIGPTTATPQISSLSVGSHTITVVYGGDGNFVGSTSPALIQVVIPSVTATFLAPLAGQPVGNKIKVGQTVPHKVDVVNSLGQSVTSGVTVRLQVQGVMVTGTTTNIVENVVEDANGVGADGTACGYGTMYFTGGHFQFNLDTGDFLDPNTLAESNKFYTSTATVIDNATSLVLGSTTINLETSSK
jgi:hypothetical protein